MTIKGWKKSTSQYKVGFFWGGGGGECSNTGGIQKKIRQPSVRSALIWIPALSRGLGLMALKAPSNSILWFFCSKPYLLGWGIICSMLSFWEPAIPQAASFSTVAQGSQSKNFITDGYDWKYQLLLLLYLTKDFLHLGLLIYQMMNNLNKRMSLYLISGTW